MGSVYNDSHERSRDRIRGWAVALLYPSMILFTLVNVQWSSFSRRLTKLSNVGAPSPTSKSERYKPLIDSLSSTSSSQTTTTTDDDQSLEEEATRLLSHVLVTISYWHSPDEKEVKFLAHTLGTIREWRLFPKIGNVSAVILTNDAAGARKSLGNTNDWYSFHQVETGELQYNLPFYHREVVADYLDRDKDGTNLTNMVNGDLPPPTAYSFMEADNVVSGLSLLAWARDTALLQREGHNRVRHFWRWEWNERKSCRAFTGQVFQINPHDDDRVFTICGKRFASLIGGGIWAGLYVLPAQHMINYYNSGDFWTLPDKYKYTREIQLHDVIHGSKAVGKPDKRSGDNTLVPFDEKTGTVDVIAGVHHQSDKYASGQSRFGKLCVDNLFNSTVDSMVKLGLGRRARNKAIRKGRRLLGADARLYKAMPDMKLW